MSRVSEKNLFKIQSVIAPGRHDRVKFPCSFPCLQGMRRRPVWQDCVRHQAVRASRHDFLGHRIARHFHGLRDAVAMNEDCPGSDPSGRLENEVTTADG